MPEIRLLHVRVTTGVPCRDSVGNAKNWLLLVSSCDREFLVATEFYLVLCHDKNSCVKTWFQISSLKNYRNMAFFVEIVISAQKVLF